MTLFPFCIDVECKNFLVVGAGKVARDKIEKLLQFTDRIKVVAKEVSDEVSSFASLNPNMTLEEKSFDEDDLNNMQVVVAATSNREVNAEIASLCRKRNIPVNVVDDPMLCSFIFPAVIREGDLTISITTNGTSPAYAGVLKKQIQEMLPKNIGEILAKMGILRPELKKNISSQSDRAKAADMILKKLLEQSDE